MLGFLPSELSVSKVHGLLLGAVGPRPIAFASTIDKQGRPNLAPFSFFNVFSANPPILIFSPARRGTNNTTKHTHDNVLEVKEVVINIVNYAMVQQMSLASSDYSEGVNEFDKAGFTMLAADLVKPWRVKEAPAQFECKVNEVIALGDGGGAGNLVVCEVLKMHFAEYIMDADLRIDQQKIDTVARMGGNWYARAHGAALFEVPKPGAIPGMGVDQIPADIRNSPILTGNDLGLLGGIPKLPNETEVNEWRLTALSDLFVAHEDAPHELELALHKHASEQIAQGKLHEAWLTLLTFNN
jgi:flavin reductase (DIM6/NTAB) family NADH-FMN oxidoreductase RutF